LEHKYISTERKNGFCLSNSTSSSSSSDLGGKKELLQYFVMLSAIAAGAVHLSIYADHSSLNIDYSIFLLLAATAQIAYGISYVLFTISDNMKYDTNDLHSINNYYRKFVTINLFPSVCA
jgi:hypothetical protein